MPPSTETSPTTELPRLPHLTSPRALLRFDTVIADTQKIEEQPDHGSTATQVITDIDGITDDSIRRQQKKTTQILLPVGMDFKFSIHTQGSSDAPQYIRFHKGMCLANKPTFATLQQMILARFKKHVTCYHA
ncbi:hypothetical protein LTR85_006570 [Meristemomyces frigidus]|nr:hypothetical protein LTR85_006570 [Meristemomyces frigidus]